MATVAAIQAQLDTQGFGKKIVIIKQFSVATADFFYCDPGLDALAGRNRWCQTDNTQTAAQQATAITTAMRA